MAEQRRRMTYEEQRALRERERGERTASRFTVDNYGSDRVSGAGRTGRAGRADRVAGAGSASGASGAGSAGRRPSQASRASARTSRTASTSRTAGTSRTASASRAAGASRTTRTTRDEFSRRNYGGAAAARPPIFKIGIAIVLLVAVVLVVRLCSAALPINVTVNGTAYELRGAKTVEAAIKTSGLPINPGDLISLNGNVLEKSAGEPFLANVNGTETSDPGFRLRDGDTVNVTDGNDIVEEYDAEQSSIPYGSSIVGMGAVHKFVAGEDGTMETRTGRISGETVEKRLVEPTDVTCQEYNVNTGANKVVAFTFDDGPSAEYTAEVLKILKDNDAKGTFFVIGQCVEEYPDLVAQEAAEGHQVCTHSYDHAEPVGGTNVGFMDAAGQIDEVVHGKKTITDVLGGEASGVVRMPGGNLTEDMVMNLQPYVDYEIGWNIDTRDWTLPGAEAIYQEMISAEPGDIILCHDGGGDRSETVEALRRALPYLKSKGFTFLTMDEMLEYPASA